MRGLLLFFLLLLPLASLACFGSEDDLFEPIEFGPEDPTATPVTVTEEVVADLAIDGFLMAEIHYLFYYREIAQSLVALNRSFESQSSRSGSQSELDLGWVVDVHDLMARSEEVYTRFFELESDDTIRDKYSRLYLDTLRAIDLMVVGRDRLLSAAILLGPTGRSYSDMLESDQLVFNTLLAEAVYWLRSSGTAAQAVSSAVSEHISRLGTP